MFNRIVNILVATSSIGLASVSQADELVPYVECRDSKNPELLISKSPDQGLFVYSKSNVNGLASKLAFGLRIGRSAESMTLTVAPSSKCRLIDNNKSFGIVKIDCELSPRTELKITPADLPQTRIAIRSGTVSYYRNIFYGGQAKVTVDFVTMGGRHVMATQDFDVQACKDDTISSPPH